MQQYMIHLLAWPESMQTPCMLAHILSDGIAVAVTPATADFWLQEAVGPS